MPVPAVAKTNRSVFGDDRCGCVHVCASVVSMAGELVGGLGAVYLGEQEDASVRGLGAGGVDFEQARSTVDSHSTSWRVDQEHPHLFAPLNIALTGLFALCPLPWRLTERDGNVQKAHGFDIPETPQRWHLRLLSGVFNVDCLHGQGVGVEF